MEEVVAALLPRYGPDAPVVGRRADGDEPVGTVRWDDEGAGEWEVSITVAPSARGRGLAGPALTAAQDWLAGHLPAPPSALLAVVHEDNTASRRLFLRAGYAPDLPPDDAGFERWVRTAG